MLFTRAFTALQCIFEVIMVVDHLKLESRQKTPVATVFEKDIKVDMIIE